MAFDNTEAFTAPQYQGISAKRWEVAHPPIAGAKRTACCNDVRARSSRPSSSFSCE